MGFLSSFFGGVAVAPIEAIGNVLNGLFTSDGERLDKKALLLKLAQQPSLAQIEINKIEASHRSIFVAGGRPAIIWVCALGIASYFLPQYIMGSFLWVKMCLAKNILVPYPVDGKNLIDLVYALLGLGVFRTAEKINKVTK